MLGKGGSKAVENNMKGNNSLIHMKESIIHQCCHWRQVFQTRAFSHKKTYCQMWKDFTIRIPNTMKILTERLKRISEQCIKWARKRLAGTTRWQTAAFTRVGPVSPVHPRQRPCSLERRISIISCNLKPPWLTVTLCRANMRLRKPLTRKHTRRKIIITSRRAPAVKAACQVHFWWLWEIMHHR